MFEFSSVIKRSAHQVSCNLNDEVAILDLNKSVYFGLDTVGAYVWEALQEPRCVADLCAAVSDHFDVTPAECREDIVRFLESLREAGLVEAVG
jgi:hypothetical protein